MQGLFKDGAPVFPGGMAVNAHNMTSTILNQLWTPRLVILEFILKDLSNIGTVGQLLHLSLLPNYTRESRDSLHHEQIIFDLNSNQEISDHVSLMKDRVRNLKMY